jgi:hypothetical protein
VPAANPNAEDEVESQRIISPFAQTTSTVQTTRGGGAGTWVIWFFSGLLALAVIAVSGYFIFKYVNDPYRTLEPFPVDKYLSDYRSLAGAKFRAELKVSADLGYQADTGRLMVFTLPNESRPVVVMIPKKLGGIYFDKGQNYKASLEVQEGGLIYADSCQKD